MYLMHSLKSLRKRSFKIVPVSSEGPEFHRFRTLFIGLVTLRGSQDLLGFR